MNERESIDSLTVKLNNLNVLVSMLTAVYDAIIELGLHKMIPSNNELFAPEISQLLELVLAGVMEEKGEVVYNLHRLEFQKLGEPFAYCIACKTFFVISQGHVCLVTTNPLVAFEFDWSEFD
jgi:hypothetical protein